MDLSTFLLLLLMFCVPSQGGVTTRELKIRHTSSLRHQTSQLSPNELKEVRGKERKTSKWVDVRDLTTTGILDGVAVWSEKSERLVPEGFSDHHIHQWQEESRSLKIKEVRTAQCGRPPNVLVILEDGRRCCCRMRRREQGYLIKGDMYAFTLSRVLGIHHVPSTTLTNQSSRHWNASHFPVKSSKLFPVALLSEWISDLEDVYVPQVLMKSDKQIRPGETLANLTSDDIVDLIQWTDMLIFDYLTANTDRMINLLHNKQWNSQILEHPVHNLLKGKDSLLIFVDNEFGLIKGQQVFDDRKDYHSLYQQVLNRTCVFRRHTVERIRDLSQSQAAGKILNAALKRLDPLAEELGSLAMAYTDGLQRRIDHVYSYMKSCLTDMK